MTDEEPVAIPDQIEIEPVKLGIGVERLFEAVAGFSTLEPVQHFVARIHVLSCLHARTELVEISKEKGTTERSARASAP